MTSDPLRAHCELPFRVRLFPLGFPVQIATNSEAVIAAVRQSWDCFSQAFNAAPVWLDLGISPGENGSLPPTPPAFRSREHLLTIVSDPDNFIVCDYATGTAFGWLTPETISDPAFARFYFLEAAVLSLIDQLYLAPVHAALIAKNGRGVLLCGDTFAGKSTLAYACARKGWTLICDDGAYLVRGRADRYAIGDPHNIRLREQSKVFFPELNSALSSQRPNGKMAIQVATKDLGISVADGAHVDHLVLLDRFANCPAALCPAAKQDLLYHFRTVNKYGSIMTRRDRDRELSTLLEAGIFRLHYQSLDCAVARLDELIEN
ncbi:MAG: hypothetical protein JO022_00625 [Acidobacteriaceae bacterium]|nr:hypothetical protein [Acidobacteriaceae bacterium]